MNCRKPRRRLRLSIELMRYTPFRNERSRFLAGAMGLRLFLVSLGIVFAASIIAFAVVRWQLTERGVWPDDLPPLPRLLWLSTAVLFISSATMQWSVYSFRAGRLPAFRACLLITLLLGITFLVIQARCWLNWIEPISQRWAESNEYRLALTSFYILTGIHAAHIIGGLIPMTMVARNVDDDANELVATVQYITMYWHFLGLVWLVLYATLLLSQAI